MALINCPRCGGKISERAQQCPHCGCTKQEMEQIAEEQRLQAEHEAEEARIQAKKEAEELAAQRREWWKNNKKKVYVVLAIIIGLAAGVQAFKVIAEHKSITLAKQYIEEPKELENGYDAEHKSITLAEQYIEEPKELENGHEYIDLGLSVKWATCNVGATKPEEYGDYFAWGETQPKSTYNWTTYKWCRGSSDTQTKYNTNSRYGTVDNKITLDLSDDAATANWGGSWRMPTKAEQYELCNNCTWTWTTQNGVKGYKVTSKSNGNSIFLPAAGYRYDSSLERAGSYGFYLSNSLDTDIPIYACYLYFHLSSLCWNDDMRYYGRSVRPVCP